MRINELLNIEFPIFQGGMANIATGEFAAAVSNAGALGTIGAGGMDAETLREHIKVCKSLTDKPFSVNIMLMNPDADKMAEIVVEEKSCGGYYWRRQSWKIHGKLEKRRHQSVPRSFFCSFG